MDSEYELSKAGYAANEINDALTFRAIAKEKKCFATLGSMFAGRRNATILSALTCGAVIVYDPAPTLRASPAPLLAILGELDTPEGVKANVRTIRQILDQPGRRDCTIKVYPNGSHSLMELPPDNPNEFVRLKRFHRLSSKQWSTGRQLSFVGMRHRGVRP